MVCVSLTQHLYSARQMKKAAQTLELMKGSGSGSFGTSRPFLGGKTGVVCGMWYDSKVIA